MKKLSLKKLSLLTPLLVCLFAADIFADSGVMGSWFQKSTGMTFTIASEGKDYFVTHKFPSGEAKKYKLALISRSGTDMRGMKFQRKFEEPGVFFRQPETYFINPDGSLTVNYSAESASLLSAR